MPIRSIRSLVLLSLVLTLAACASRQASRRVWSEPAATPGEAPRATAPPLVIEPEGGAGVAPAPDYPRSAEQVSGAAVTSLMRQARAALDGGQPAQAAASLERALRIEPRNYFVWSLLAQTYLAQGNFSQADSVAGKSNALARGNAYVELENWRTIAAARLAQGDVAGEAVARERVDALQSWLYPTATP